MDSKVENSEKWKVMEGTQIRTLWRVPGNEINRDVVVVVTHNCNSIISFVLF